MLILFSNNSHIRAKRLVLYLCKMDVAGIVHISAIFAITLIVVIEIRLGRNSGTWVPLLTTLIGYIMPQPKLNNQKRILQSVQSEQPAPVIGEQESFLGRITALMRVTWPSVLLVGSAIAWFSLSVLTQTSNLNATLS